MKWSSRTNGVSPARTQLRAWGRISPDRAGARDGRPADPRWFLAPPGLRASPTRSFVALSRGEC
ncbi:hypothetical protein EST54_27410 [Streptomyces sioyaensis]|uniref:Uncharacterized protein n=1 Tax=Streptomyces sioyaensis TaxID=67364 RepID=A0A4Q1QNM5_9ACTN|nr:hypothetical protein EST54_27410 [Streptomyces sioyaensis]